MAISEWYLNRKKLPNISIKSQTYIRNLKPHKASYWDITTNDMKEFKKELLEKLCKIQNNRCVYCGLGLSRRSIDREHFVHKAAIRGYQEFMFNFDNLFAACEFCNRRLKGQKQVIKTYNKDYSKCSFRIVHPFYDTPDTFMQFLPSKDDPVRVIPTDTDCGKGKKTIEMFKLDSWDMYLERLGYIEQTKADRSRFSDILKHKA